MEFKKPYLVSIVVCPEALYLVLIPFALHKVALPVVRAWDDQQALGAGAGQVVFIGHGDGNKMIVCSMNEDDRDTTVPQSFRGGILVRTHLDLLLEDLIGDRAAEAKGNMEIVVRHVLPD